MTMAPCRVDLQDGVGGVFDEFAKAAFGEHFGAGVGFLLGEANFAFLQGFCGFGTLGDVAGDLGDADDGAVGVDDGGKAEGDEDLLSILMLTRYLGMVDAAAVAQDGEEEVDAFLFAGPGEEGDGVADGLVRFVAEDSGGGGIPAGDDAGEGHAEDGVVGGFDDGGEPALGRGAVVSFRH